MTKIYTVLNKRDCATEERMSISTADMTEVSMCKVWCINFRNMLIEEALLIGVGEDNEHYIALTDVATGDDDSAWAVPEYNVFYDKQSAEKGLFKAHLKYE